IRRACDRTGDDAVPLLYASRLAGKVDTAAVQDGYQLYHHSFFYVPGRPTWCVVQQGLNAELRYARRYHWSAELLKSYVAEPHAAVACDWRGTALNLVAGEGESHRRAVAETAREHPEKILREIRHLFRAPAMPLFEEPAPSSEAKLHLPARHS